MIPDKIRVKDAVYRFSVFMNKLILMNTIEDLRCKEERSPLLMLGLVFLFFILELMFRALSAGESFILLLLSLALALIGFAR